MTINYVVDLLPMEAGLYATRTHTAGGAIMDEFLFWDGRDWRMPYEKSSPLLSKVVKVMGWIGPLSRRL